MSTGTAESHILGSFAISRSAAFVRGALWIASALLCGAGVAVVFQSLDFSPAGASNRIVDLCILAVTLPVVATGLYLLVLGLRWIGLSVWPGAVGIVATDGELVLRLGAFGTRRFDVSRLDLKYAFELSGDEDDGGFESFLPEEEQMANYLPRILHLKAKDRIDRMILKFSQGAEADIARALRPAFEVWRTKKD